MNVETSTLQFFDKGNGVIHVVFDFVGETGLMNDFDHSDDSPHVLWPQVADFLPHSDLDPYVPPVRIISPEMVKAERQLRIALVVPADKEVYYLRLVASYQDRELNGGDPLTPAETDRLALIRAGYAAIDALVLKAEELEAMDPIPTDYKDDLYWS